MAKSTRIGLILAVIFSLLGILIYVGQPPSKTPEELISDTLQSAGQAAKQGDVGGVMDAVSDDFQAGDWNKARLRLMLNQTLSQGRGTDYDVHVNEPNIIAAPSGRDDEREVTTRFAAFYPDGGDIYKSNDQVVLIMRAETRRRYLIFREPHWRIISVLNLPSLPGSSGGELGM